MCNIPNILTIVRLLLVPVIGLALVEQAYRIALALFLVAALTDLADGYIARRFGLVSRLGATLDPIADKLNMLVATVLLAWQDLLPLPLAIAIVARDAVIVTGALAYRAAVGNVQIAPTFLSKLNTFLEFGLLLLVMARAAGWLQGTWLPVLYAIVFLTVAASGVQYVWLWGRKAIAERRHRSPRP
ncbi:MAG: CDP-alcohol phosphatidyltransferase family protein [Casimicrobiaceae bacterium]